MQSTLVNFTYLNASWPKVTEKGIEYIKAKQTHLRAREPFLAPALTAGRHSLKLRVNFVTTLASSSPLREN